MSGMARQKSDTPGRLAQIRQAYVMTKQVDTKIGLIIAGVGLLTFGVFLAIGFALDHPIYLGILGFVVAVLAVANVFGRRAERAAFGQMEGKPNRVRPLLAAEKKKMSRVVGDIPVHDIVVGNGEGEIPLKKLQIHLMS